MGFWSSLGKGLLGVGGLIAAPFTGGASAATILPAILGAGGAVAGAIGEAKTQNRGVQDNFAQQALRDFETQQVNRARLDLDRREDDRAAEQTAFQNAIRSALAKNMQDAAFSRPEGVPMIAFSGGARPSALGEEGREAAALMNNRAMQALMTGPSPHTPLSDPTLLEPKKAGFWEKLLGPVGLGLTAASNFNRMAGAAPSGQQAPSSGTGWTI